MFTGLVQSDQDYCLGHEMVTCMILEKSTDDKKAWKITKHAKS